MRRTTTIAAVSTALVLGVGGLSSCGSSEDGSSAAKTPSATPSATPSSTASASPTPSASTKAPTKRASDTAMLTITDYEYSGPTEVAAGTRITVRNNDSEAHTVTADTGGAFDVVIPPGASRTFSAPRKAGTYKYHCTYHADMHGTLTVS